MSEFVRASRLYHVSSRTPIAHPAHQASDDDVRRALEEREIRTDGGHSGDVTDRSVIGSEPCEIVGYNREKKDDGDSYADPESLFHSSKVVCPLHGDEKPDAREETDNQNRNQSVVRNRLRAIRLSSHIFEPNGKADRSNGLAFSTFNSGQSLQTDTDHDDREIRTDGGTDTNQRCVPVRIDGARVPACQIDRFDGDVIVHVDVASAVSDGFDFTGIWRCKRVTVEMAGREFAATVTACSVEHGIAAIRLTDLETFESGGGSR